MPSFKKMSSDLLKPSFHNLVVLFLIVYIVSDTNISEELFEVINETPVKVILIATCLYVIVKHSPVLGCLALIAIYELMTRNNMLIIPSLASSTPNVLINRDLMPINRFSQNTASKKPLLHKTKKYEKPISYANYETSNDKKSKIMEKLEENKSKVSLEEDIINNIASKYNNTEEQSNVQPVLAKQIEKGIFTL
jgi:hypothetical protein